MAGENNLELEIKGDKDKVKERIESLKMFLNMNLLNRRQKIL